jgi:hypothetical protein
VDAKTLLLLGAGMAVLSLVGFCSAQSRSAGMVVGRVSMHGPPPPEAALAALPAGTGRSLRDEIETKMLFMQSKVPVAPVGAKR